MDELKQFLPLEWDGKTEMDQYELFDQLLMYLTQHELHKMYTRKIKHKEWVKKAPITMCTFSHRFACQFIKDILEFYKVPELFDFKNIQYTKNKNTIDRTYAIYDDYFDNGRYTIASKYNWIYVYMSAFTAY